MQAANAGYLHAVQRCMGIAHGQRGKPRRRKVEVRPIWPFTTCDLRLTLRNCIQELLREARTTEAAPLQPGNPRTRPPVYPPRLQAYLTSSHSYAKGKAPTPSQLQSPQRMPLRADPNSEEARLLGRLSPRREANIKWRYLAELRSRLVAPLDPRDIQTLGEQAQTFKLPDDMKRAEIKSLPEDLQDRFRELSRKGRKQSAWARPKRITSRFMRRRYEDLLNNAVHLDAAVTPDDKVKWSVKQSVSRRALARRFVATKEDHEWTPPT